MSSRSFMSFFNTSRTTAPDTSRVQNLEELVRSDLDSNLLDTRVGRVVRYCGAQLTAFVVTLKKTIDLLIEPNSGEKATPPEPTSEAGDRPVLVFKIYERNIKGLVERAMDGLDHLSPKVWQGEMFRDRIRRQIDVGFFMAAQMDERFWARVAEKLTVALTEPPNPADKKKDPAQILFSLSDLSVQDRLTQAFSVTDPGYHEARDARKAEIARVIKMLDRNREDCASGVRRANRMLNEATRAMATVLKDEDRERDAAHEAHLAQLKIDREIRVQWEGADAPEDYADVAEEGEDYDQYMKRITASLSERNKKIERRKELTAIIREHLNKTGQTSVDKLAAPSMAAGGAGSNQVENANRYDRTSVEVDRGYESEGQGPSKRVRYQ
ncbi:hypothetical protein MJO29_012665 [Puccinia striiformis f. sp. tritici]|nr:hypothetical protein MJO29_012665 [Puccinia striiformis f. sp. tritici]